MNTPVEEYRIETNTLYVIFNPFIGKWFAWIPFSDEKMAEGTSAIEAYNELVKQILFT